MVSWDGWLGTRYSTPPGHPSSHHPGYTSSTPLLMHAVTQRSAARSKWVVGLRSVAQLTLSAHISGFGTITEVYNLLVAGITNDH